MRYYITFIALLGMVSANAQSYRVTNGGGNKVKVSKRCADNDVYYNVQQDSFYGYGDECAAVSTTPVFDKVINEDVSEENILQIENKVINVYHQENTEVRHYRLAAPVRAVTNNVRYVQQRPIYMGERYSGYEPARGLFTDMGGSYGLEWAFSFQLNSDYLPNSGGNNNELMRLIDFAKSNRHCMLQIDAYADADTGTMSYNDSLSRRRARAIISILGNEGIGVDRMVVRCHGSVNQRYGNNNLNRCVIVKVAD